MTTATEGGGFWRQVAQVLLGVLLTGAGSWMVFGQDRLSEADAKQMLRETLEARDARLLKVENLVDKLASQQQALVLELRVLVAELKASKK